MAANKFYAVKIGKKTGIFSTWEECSQQVKGYPGAIYKSFLSRTQADNWLQEKTNSPKVAPTHKIYTDGSYDKDTDFYSYGVIVLNNDQVISKFGGVGDNKKFGGANNVSGEIMAAINALEWCIRHNISDVCIYHDYEGVSRWYLNEWESNSQIARFYIKKRDQAFKALNVSFVKVKGHSNNEYNDMADAEAKKAIKNMKKNN